MAGSWSDARFPSPPASNDAACRSALVKLRWLFTLVAAAVLVVFGSQWATTTDPSPAPADPVPVPTQSLPAPASPAAVVNADVGSLIVPDVAVRDTDGRIVWRGDV